MRLLQYLKEEWETSIKSWPGGVAQLYNVYKNPTSSDYIKIKKDSNGRVGVRALAYPETRSVYVFSDEVLHHIVIRHLGLKKIVFAITGYIKNNKIWVDSLNLYGDDIEDMPDNNKRKYMDKYFLNLEKCYEIY